LSQPKRHTSSDVARLAGVSQATVSRAFNNPSYVNPETRNRILDAARQLNYTPNEIAKSLVSQRTNLIGLIMADIANPFYTGLMDRLSEALVAQGKKLLLFNGTKTTTLAQVMLDAVCFQVDGLVIASAELANHLLTDEMFFQPSIPIVLINAQRGSEQVCSVCCDNISSGRQIAEYLIGQGCVRFCYLGGPDRMSSSALRWKGYSQQLVQAGWREEEIFCQFDEYTYASGYQAGKLLIRTFDGRRTGVFCGNDLIAMGVLDAIREDGNLQVPQDFSLIGFDDIPQAEWHAYNLSSMQFPVESMVQDTLSYLNGEPRMSAGLHLYPCTLIERKSS
jgi:DNA-binding LacI/PurR family transcriptional regulator